MYRVIKENKLYFGIKISKTILNSSFYSEIGIYQSHLRLIPFQNSLSNMKYKMYKENNYLNPKVQYIKISLSQIDVIPEKIIQTFLFKELNKMTARLYFYGCFSLCFSLLPILLHTGRLLIAC
jgi:hypothetical protein